MSKVGPFTLGKTLFRDSNLAYIKGESKKHDDVLLVFLGDKVLSSTTSKELDDELIPAQTQAEFEFVSKPFPHSVSHLLPLVGKGHCEGNLILAYPYVEAIPFYVHMKTVPTIHRRIVLKYTIEIVSMLRDLHKYKLRSTEVNIGNIFIDDKENLYLGYNCLAEDKSFVSETLKKHPQVKRFDVVTPEEVWGNGADNCSDVFQAGALAVTMLTRRVLKLSSNVRKMGYTAVSEGYYPPEDFTEGLPKALGKCILKALEPDPVDRYESVDELLEGLEEVAEASKITDAVSEVMHQRYSKTKNVVGSDKKPDSKDTGPHISEKPDSAESGDNGAKTPSGDSPKSGRGDRSDRSRKSRKNDGKKSVKTTEASFPLIPPEYEQYKIPAIGGVAFLFILFIMWPFGGDIPVSSSVQTKKPVRTTKKPDRSTRTPTKKAIFPRATTSTGSSVPTKTTASGKASIDVTSITADLNAAISRPTDKSTFGPRKALLQKCYRMLPREHRGKAIRSSVFQLLYEYEKQDKGKAYKFVDETFQKYYDYLQVNNAKM